MTALNGTFKAALAAGTLLLATAGCADRPYQYGQDRPPVDQLTEGNTGLQSKDVVSATDQMATDLLSLPELNASQKQWTIVLDKVVNNTNDARDFSYNVFSTRLKSKLFQLGHGRVALIENKAKYHTLQSNELEQSNDQFGQGGGNTGPGLAGIQPDYSLYITIDNMPNRATDYFLVTGTLVNLKTRVQVWESSPPYEVQVAR